MSRRSDARTTGDELDLAGGTEHLRDPAQWHAFVDALFETDWVVYAKPAFGGASAVLRYLGRYTHRVAISNHRLLAFDGEHVTFQWKDYAHGDQRRTMTLIRDGVSAPLRPAHPAARLRAHPAVGVSREHLSRRPAWRSRGPLLATPVAGSRIHDATATATTETTTRATWACPRCGAAMIVGPILSALHLATVTLGFDTS